MSTSFSTQARLFRRCAFGRYEDAEILLEADHITGAVYLAGYGIECILKALIFSSTAPKVHDAMLDIFRGVKAHDYGWLRERYYETAGARFPEDINQTFTSVDDWSTDLRYLPRSLKPAEANDFFMAAKTIIWWVDGRI